MITECFVTTSGGVTTRLDLEADIPLPITYNILDIREPETNISHWSKTLKFPGTKTNNQLFKHIFEIGIDGGFNPNKKADVYFLQDTLPVLTGVLQLKKITRSEELNLIYYECNAFGGNDGLFTKIGDSKLTDIDFAAYNHEYSRDNQEDSWAQTPGSGYVYPMIDYKGKSPDDPVWKTQDFFPALFVKDYIDRIFAFAEKTYTSSFLTSNFFKRLIIPFNKETYRFSNEEIEEREIRAERSSNLDRNTLNAGSASIINIVFDNDSSGSAYDPGGGYDTTTGIWTVPAGHAGNYNIEFRGDIAWVNTITGGVSPQTSITGTGDVSLEVRVSVNGVYKVISDKYSLTLTSGNSYNPDTIHGLQTASVSLGPIQLNEGDEVRITFWDVGRTFTFNTTGGGTTTFVRRIYTGAYFRSVLLSGIVEGADLSMNSCIPENITMKDFFVSIIDMFRLYMQADVDNVDNYTIEPRDDWFTSDIIDWSNKLDRKQGLEFIPMAELQGRRYIFTYKEDKDYYNDLYQKNVFTRR